MQHYTSSCSGLWLQQLSGNTRTMNLFNFSLKKPTRQQGNQTWNIILANSGWNKWLPDILFKMYNFDFFPLILASQVSSTLYFNSVLTTTYYLSYFSAAFDLLKDGNTFFWIVSHAVCWGFKCPVNGISPKGSAQLVYGIKGEAPERPPEATGGEAFCLSSGFLNIAVISLLFNIYNGSIRPHFI